MKTQHHKLILSSGFEVPHVLGWWMVRLYMLTAGHHLAHLRLNQWVVSIGWDIPSAGRLSEKCFSPLRSSYVCEPVNQTGCLAQF